MDASADICQICFQPKRKVRFRTPRLKICQWCVTEICSAERSPNNISETKRLAIEAEYRLNAEVKKRRIEAQQKSLLDRLANELARIPIAALSEAEREEGIIQSVCRSVFNDSARRNRAAEIATTMRNRIEALRVASSVEYQEMHLRLETEMVSIDAAVARDLQGFVESCLVPIPTKSKDARLLRARAVGLINSEHVQLERPVEPEYDALRRLVRQGDENRCVRCGKDYSSGPLHVHHVIPLSQFGTNDCSNLVTLCYSCHNAQHKFKVTRNQPIRRAPRQVRFIAVDIETTGLSNEDSIIEIGAALFVDGKLKDTFQTFVYTKREIPRLITRLTGISKAQLATAPKANEAFKLFKKFIGETRLVFHNADFDMRFLKRYAEHFDCSITNTIDDTLRVSRKKLPSLSNHKLDFLVGYFGLPVRPKHRATDDAISTGLLYLKLAVIEEAVLVPKKPRNRKSSERETAHQKIHYPDAEDFSQVRASKGELLLDVTPTHQVFLAPMNDEAQDGSITPITLLEGEAPVTGDDAKQNISNVSICSSCGQPLASDDSGMSFCPRCQTNDAYGLKNSANKHQEAAWQNAGLKRGDFQMKTILECDNCGQKLSVPSEKLLDVICPKCRTTFRTFT